MATTMKALRKVRAAKGLAIADGGGSDDWADGRAGARIGCVDLRDGFAYLWVG